MNPNVLDAFRTHLRIRRAENADPDDLLLEVQKWWDDADRFDPTSEVLRLSSFGDERQLRFEGGYGNSRVPLGLRIAVAGARR